MAGSHLPKAQGPLGVWGWCQWHCSIIGIFFRRMDVNSSNHSLPQGPGLSLSLGRESSQEMFTLVFSLHVQKEGNYMCRL